MGQSPSDQAKEVEQLTRAAQTATEQGRYQDAIQSYGAITLIATATPKVVAAAHLGMGNAFMALNKFPEAAAAFQRSISLDANSAESLNNLGEALGELKQYPQAIESFQKAAALDSSFLKPRYNMGVTYERMGQLKYAEFVYRLLVRDHPDFALGYDSLAVILAKSARAREAVPFHEKAITLANTEPSFYYNFGVSYLILGETAKARELQQRLVTLDPRMAEQLASVIAKRGK